MTSMNISYLSVDFMLCGPINVWRFLFETNLFGACNHCQMLNGPPWVMLMVFEIGQLGFPLIVSEHIHQLNVFQKHQFQNCDILDLYCSIVPDH